MKVCPTCVVLVTFLLVLCTRYILLKPLNSSFDDKIDYYFPKDFVFGVGSSAFQTEGAWNEDGKGESIIDHMVHSFIGIFSHNSTADIACDSYHKYKEDVQLIKALGVDFYRFSISWTRILPNGEANHVNQAGIDYYNHLIDELLANGIQPYVTMFHFDLPQDLEYKGGWYAQELSDYFVDYARLLFENFGDRVKYWMTFNEIIVFCRWRGGITITSLVHKCVHTAMLAHGRTYRMYENEFRKTQNGYIGTVVLAPWYEPNNTENVSDQAASEVSEQLNFGWSVKPLVHGTYPEAVIEAAAQANVFMPQFTQEEVKIVNGSLDFVGLNHYTSNLVSFEESKSKILGGLLDFFGWKNFNPNLVYFNKSALVVFNYDPSWEGSPVINGLKTVPYGIRKMLVYIKDHYGNIPVLITENGFADDGRLEDYGRADYLKSYLYEILKAVHEEKCNVIGYTAWSLMDLNEFVSARSQFGLYQVDYDDVHRTRTPKLSSYVYKNIITTGHIDWEYYPQWPPYTQVPNSTTSTSVDSSTQTLRPLKKSSVLMLMFYFFSLNFSLFF